MTRIRDSNVGPLTALVLRRAGLTRLQGIVLLRRLDGLTLQEIAEERGVSRQAIHKMLVAAVAKVRRAVLQWGRDHSIAETNTMLRCPTG